MHKTKTRASLTHAQFYRVTTWLTSQAKEGVLSTPRTKLAVDCSESLGFPISVCTITDAAAAANLTIPREGRTRGANKTAGRVKKLSRLILMAFAELEKSLDKPLFSKDTIDAISAMACAPDNL